MKQVPATYAQQIALMEIDAGNPTDISSVEEMNNGEYVTFVDSDGRTMQVVWHNGNWCKQAT